MNRDNAPSEAACTAPNETDRASASPASAAPSERAVCAVCPHACVLKDGQVGICGARQAVDGQVVDQNYGRLTSIALDPIEKKPIARWMPGSLVLSVGSYGCNLRCPFCQNSSIACARENDIPWQFLKPEELVALADISRAEHDTPVIGLAYTYNEPLVGFEYMRDCATLAHERGLLNVMVSNGYANRPVIEELLGLIDAANIDLKGFTQEFYDFVGGDLATVKETIELFARDPSRHLEVTTLVIPGRNDSPDEIAQAAEWLASLDPEIPYHLTRFFPCHRLRDTAPTDVDSLYRLQEVAQRYLKTVLVGNV